MKKVKTHVLTLFLTLIAVTAFSQENMVTLSYGFPFAHIEEVDDKAQGWRITGLYEFSPMDGKIAHGLSVGYVSVSGENSEAFTDVEFKVSSWPIYYAPKFMFGSEKVKGFIKGALGWQFSKLSLKGGGAIGLEGEDNDSGFAGGGGAGIMYLVKENIFLNLEYEYLWLSNSFYRDESLNTISLGLGIKF